MKVFLCSCDCVFVLLNRDSCAFVLLYECVFAYLNENVFAYLYGCVFVGFYMFLNRSRWGKT